MGVEPTQQRVAPLTGFEARPTHQDRFPSMASVVIVLQATKLLMRSVLAMTRSLWAVI